MLIFYPPKPFYSPNFGGIGEGGSICCIEGVGEKSLLAEKRYFCENFLTMGVIHVTLEVLNEETMAILEQLERLNLIRLVEQHRNRQRTKKNWIGVISKETGEKMLKHVENSRNEWERNIS